MLAILFYDYVPNVVERRQPFREAHLGLAGALHAQGKLRLAGAFADPTDGAALVFSDRGAAEAFAKVDPYIANGLVTKWWIRDWNVVIGG